MELETNTLNCYCIKTNVPTSIKVQGDPTTVTAYNDEPLETFN